MIFVPWSALIRTKGSMNFLWKWYICCVFFWIQMCPYNSNFCFVIGIRKARITAKVYGPSLPLRNQILFHRPNRTSNSHNSQLTVRQVTLCWSAIVERYSSGSGGNRTDRFVNYVQQLRGCWPLWCMPRPTTMATSTGVIGVPLAGQPAPKRPLTKD